ncbi:MAG: glycosyltransferase family 2 protein [Anaerolineaceae bacterium]
METDNLKPSCSVVIPVYNSERSLPLLVERLHAELPKLCSEYEIILVNDDSRDGSWTAIQALCAASPRVLGVDLMRNFGQHNALLCGIRQARYELILTMDDDLQHPPEEAYKLFARLAEGFDVVYGAPAVEKHGFWRDLSSRLIKKLLHRLMSIKSAATVSAFRLFRAEICEAFADYKGAFVSIDVLLSWGTTRFASVLVNHQEREHGKSNYSFKKLMNHALTLITGFSNAPLRFASITGFVFTAFGFIVLLYVLISYIVRGGSLPGFPFLASIISIFSGVQLFALGIFGEYLGRMFTRTLNKPVYTVRQMLNEPGHAGKPEEQA